MKMFKIIPFLITVLVFSNLYAQDFIYDWETDMCECTGEFDPEKMTYNEIDNTFNYLFWGPIINTRAKTRYIKNIPKLNEEELENEFSELKQILDTLNLPDYPYWKNLMEAYIKEVKSIYDLKRQTILAYNNPMELMNHEIGYNACGDYADALISGSADLMSAWYGLHQEKMTTNGNPDLLHSRFMEKATSPDSLIYAKLEVMTFGWWNCANRTIPYVPRGGETHNMFNALFDQVDCDCSPP